MEGFTSIGSTRIVVLFSIKQLIKLYLTVNKVYLITSSLQVNLALMQKQLSEAANGNAQPSVSTNRENCFSGGVGALGIMNNRLAETSVDR